MNTQHTPEPRAAATSVMSGATRERLNAIARKLKDKELFPEKVRKAKAALQGLTALPG